MDVIRTLCRTLSSSRRLALGVVTCTAVGMAATGALAALLEVALIEAPPFPQADRLVRVWNADDMGGSRQSLAWADLADLREGVPGLERIEAAGRARLVWQRPDRPGRRVEGEAVTRGYFELLGVEPFLGRSFTAEEWRGEGRPLLLGYQTWLREFDGDPSVLGRTVSASTQNLEPPALYTIVGVLPSDFHGTIEDDMPDLEFWLPSRTYLSPDARGDRAVRSLLAIGRLAPDTGVETVAQQSESLARRLAPEYRRFGDAHTFMVEPLGANWRAPYRRAAPLLSLAAGLLLAIAAVNVALLVLTRAVERRRELALRQVLGAGRGQLLRAGLVEIAVLVVIGAAIGGVAAPMLLETVLRLGDVQVPLYVSPAPSAVTLLLAFAVLLAVALTAACLPFALATRAPPGEVVNDSGARTGEGRRSIRLRRSLVAAQLALSLALLTASGLLARSYLALADAPLGFVVEDKVRLGLFVNTADVPEDDELAAFAERVTSHLESQPGVQAAGVVWPTVPILDAIRGRAAHPDLTGADGEGLLVSNYIVGDDFFDALGISVLAGRPFDALDGESGERRAIVSESLAARFGGAADVLGEIVRLNGNPFRIVGVVGDARFGGPREGPEHRYEMYLSFRQLPRRLMTTIVRVEGDAVATAPRLAAALGEIAPSSAVDWVDAVPSFLAWLHRDTTFRLTLVLSFAASALVLTIAGVYALFAQQVLRTHHEIGVRKALGASDARIAARVLGSAVGVLATGVVAGVVLGLAAGRLMQGLLYGVPAADVVAVAGACGLLSVLVLLAVLGPALRAARVVPLDALRCE